MPITPTYPGVYIEEIPSGVRTITGIATSITAFIGRALRGPVDEAVLINSYGDFERRFGGLWVDSTLGFAVRDFYLNGGSQAVIVRLYQPDADPAKSLATLTLGSAPNTLTLEAASEGAWGNNLRARIDHDLAVSDAQAISEKLFNLSVQDTSTGEIETFRNVSVMPGHARQVDNVLKNQSKLVRVSGALPAERPDDSDAALNQAIATGSAPGATDAEKQAQATAEAELKKDPFESAQRSTGVADADKATDGQALTEANFTGSGTEANKTGLYALEQADLFSLLCIPPYNSTNDVDASLIDAAIAYCQKRRAMLLIDPPSTWTDKDKAKTGIKSEVGSTSENAAIFFPRLKQANPLKDNQVEEFVPCGTVAGVFSRTDGDRGIWKAPAGLEATLVGVPQLSVSLTDAENGELNQLGINCLRTMPAAGRVIWGSRTRVGDDRLASEWKYIPVRRLALYLQESLYRGTQWVVFEPNDEPLWSQIRLNLGAFMNNLFRQGAFQGKSPAEAYFVKCDKETTTQDDINLGIVNIMVGFAPLKPAEFVIIKFQQLAGQSGA
ncbi:MAG: phage tail sheath family protein [Moorea sp. SIO3I7]|uniref:phage tail sheath family protein n=1 Tax=unclassified Moorena TaxID=2683338 RepID=UPI0013BF66AF|nr:MULTISPECIES: phage tail sheath C-terminal domain-containing protein [unclassified Moorena]NEN95766.1 phage tail sheath family protein [Moorena sp. SIO3I7]NEO06780.1 phage tail sheath family protein [Moorena sp. SIO3I8]NEP25157.1 phage tail sheath family protein [Moorena sp. SIO3I6]